jgi:hypothetical protein
MLAIINIARKERELKMKFQPGMVLATPGAIDALDKESEFDLSASGPGLAAMLVVRHLSGDWGSVPDDDKALNDEALLDGSRVMSAYILEHTQIKLWIITEWDRSVTTLLLPSEY